jgi:hypothetical protein
LTSQYLLCFDSCGYRFKNKDGFRELFKKIVTLIRSATTIRKAENHMLKKSKSTILWLALFLTIIPLSGHAQIGNGGFETGFFPPWTINLGFRFSTQLPTATIVNPAIARNTNTLNKVRIGGGNSSCEVFSGYMDFRHQDWASVTQTAPIPAGTSFLSVWFAGVLSGYHFLNPGVLVTADTYIKLEISIAGGACQNGVIFSQTIDFANNLAELTDEGRTEFPYGAFRYLPWRQYSYDLTGYT